MNDNSPKDTNRIQQAGSRPQQPVNRTAPTQNRSSESGVKMKPIVGLRTDNAGRPGSQTGRTGSPASKPEPQVGKQGSQAGRPAEQTASKSRPASAGLQAAAFQSDSQGNRASAPQSSATRTSSNGSTAARASSSGSTAARASSSGSTAARASSSGSSAARASSNGSSAARASSGSNSGRRKKKKSPEGIFARLIKTPAFLLTVGGVIAFAIVFFVVASNAGWINTFLTPEGKYAANNSYNSKITDPSSKSGKTTTEDDEDTDTTTEKSGDKETTTEEETEIEEDSYYIIVVNTARNIVKVYERGERITTTTIAGTATTTTKATTTAADPTAETTTKEQKRAQYEMTPVKCFTCSAGTDENPTPTGYYHLGRRAKWCDMINNVYAQYTTEITDGIWFHSVPYYKQNDPGSLETDQYNILGYRASSGCVRLTVDAAYWIYRYAAEGTEVRITDDWDDYTYDIDPETVYRIPTEITQLSGWDPTDVFYAENPWNTYKVTLKTDTVTVPTYCSVDDMVSAFGPKDNFGNKMNEYFRTEGGYDLYVEGTYTTTAHVILCNKEFTFEITIIVADDAPPVTSEEETSSDEEPSSEEPSSEEPTSEEPSSEEPTPEEPSSEEPASEEPSSEEEQNP